MVRTWWAGDGQHSVGMLKGLKVKRIRKDCNRTQRGEEEPFEAPFEAQGKQGKHFEAQRKRARIGFLIHGGE